MMIGINYRFHLEIYYNREKLSFDNEIIDINYIVQESKFKLQSEHRKQIVGIYIDKGDIKKYSLIKNT